jgi:predicted RNase H-like HicB family nuclease
MADGPTYPEAVANVQTIIREWLETAAQVGRPVPQPRGRPNYA